MANTTRNDRLVLTVVEAAQVLGLGRNSAYEAIRRREIPSIRVGGRILVPRAALETLLARAGQGAAGEPRRSRRFREATRR